MGALSRMIAIAGLLVGAICLYGAFTWPVIDVGAIVRAILFVAAVAQLVPMLGFRFGARPPALVTWIVWLSASLVILLLGGEAATWVIDRWRGA